LLVALFSDVHGNEAAMRAVAADIEKRGVDRVCFLGDAVGYYPNPNECLSIIRDIAQICIMGNHDYAALGILESKSFNSYAREAIEWTKDALKRKWVEFMSGFVMTSDEEDMFLVHATPMDPEAWNYIFSLADADLNFGYFDSPVCFVGHSHRPVVIAKRGDEACSVHQYDPAKTLALHAKSKYIINIGSVGQPRDGIPDACYCLYEPDARKAQLVRVPYDVSETQLRTINSGLPEYLADRLALGK
jgi:diadenosine tetraphosphatase ApaH/serine/threonine PP2A family protein phosphatase